MSSHLREGSPGTTPAALTPWPTTRVVLAAVLDVAAVVAFALGGRATHEADSPLGTVVRIAWPFLVGLLVGWFVLRAWKSPMAPWPVGVGIWAVTWSVGVALRGLTGEGLAVPFLVVSALFLGATLVGWRLVAAGYRRLRRF